MPTNKQADDFIRNIYREVWQCYSTQGFAQHYYKGFIARSQGQQFCYDELHELLKSNQEYLSFMRPETYCTLAQGDDRITSWFTQVHYNHSNKEAFGVGVFLLFIARLYG